MKPIAVNQKAIRSYLNHIFETASICLAKTVPALLFALLVTTIVTAGPISANLWAQESEVVDRIVAVVNNEIITLYDLNRAYTPYVNNIKSD